MPAAIGLLPSQQESFEHHEELSKISNETEVFYVPFQHDFHHNQDLSNLAKRFDEDILNKHLVVTFRDIGYSLFLDSVRSIPDQNDQSKTRISGKMIVDGICIQFLGCFDCIQDHSNIQQINGVGKVQLDEDYYRELASTQMFLNEKTMDTLDQIEALAHMDGSFPHTKARSRTISENILGKNQNNILKSPPSSLSNSRSRLHSPGHYPYTLRSPRTIPHPNKQQHQHQASSPINIDSSSVSRSSGFHSSFISPGSSLTSSYNENPLDLSQQHAQQHISILSQSPQFSSSPHQHPSTIPIRIPSSNIPIPAGSLPHVTGILPITQSHSLPAYFLPQGNLTYLITHPNSNQPLHLLRSLNPSTIISSPYSNIAFATTSNESQVKQTEEQLPFKKRRYNVGQSPSSAYSPMDINHDDDETSSDSMKK